MKEKPITFKRKRARMVWIVSYCEGVHWYGFAVDNDRYLRVIQIKLDRSVVDCVVLTDVLRVVIFSSNLICSVSSFLFSLFSLCVCLRVHVYASVAKKRDNFSPFLLLTLRFSLSLLPGAVGPGLCASPFFCWKLPFSHRMSRRRGSILLVSVCLLFRCGQASL